MEYVMVPVPEEHAPAVMMFLQWNLAKLPDNDDWTEETTEQFLEAIDDRTRGLLLRAARASVDAVVLAVPDVAEELDCSINEVLGMTLALNDAVRRAGGPPWMLGTGLVPGAAETGPTGWSIQMVGEVARGFLQAAGGVPGPIE